MIRYSIPLYTVSYAQCQATYFLNFQTTDKLIWKIDKYASKSLDIFVIKL